MRKLCGTILVAAVAFAAQGAAMLECSGLVTDDVIYGCEEVGVQSSSNLQHYERVVFAQEGVKAAEELKAICDKNGWPLWGMFNPAYDWLFKTGLPSEFYSRDYVHSGELGKQLIAQTVAAYFKVLYLK